jgi:hypothetical protein
VARKDEKLQYKVLGTSSFPRDEAKLEQLLNDLGEENWELVMWDKRKFVFMRTAKD